MGRAAAVRLLLLAWLWTELVGALSPPREAVVVSPQGLMRRQAGQFESLAEQSSRQAIQVSADGGQSLQQPAAAAGGAGGPQIVAAGGPQIVADNAATPGAGGNAGAPLAPDAVKPPCPPNLVVMGQFGQEGTAGEQGEEGPEGLPGPPGPSGSSIQGFRGVEGPMGPKGSRGPRGEPGEKGSQGLPGLLGKPPEEATKWEALLRHYNDDLSGMEKDFSQQTKGISQELATAFSDTGHYHARADDLLKDATALQEAIRVDEERLKHDLRAAANLDADAIRLGTNMQSTDLNEAKRLEGVLVSSSRQLHTAERAAEEAAEQVAKQVEEQVAPCDKSIWRFVWPAVVTGFIVALLAWMLHLYTVRDKATLPEPPEMHDTFVGTVQ